ncbi:MAG: hypothetical protein ACTSUE_25630 [Promethearchaeota archaeon]
MNVITFEAPQKKKLQPARVTGATTPAVELFYSDKKREDVRTAFFNFRKILTAVSIILVGVSLVLTYEILFVINRGDNNFPSGVISMGNFIIPWAGWHDWLEMLSTTMAILSGIIIAMIVVNISIVAYYNHAIPGTRLVDVMSRVAIAERDIAIRRDFQRNYGEIYDKIKSGEVNLLKHVEQKAMTPIVSATNLPSIKMPPKIAIAAPGAMKIPVPVPGAPPPIPGGITKQKPTGPVTGEKKIFVRCDRCQKTLGVKIPKKLVLDNELEVVPISIIHGEGDNKHILTVFLDPDFKSRRDRVSDMLYFE